MKERQPLSKRGSTIKVRKLILDVLFQNPMPTNGLMQELDLPSSDVNFALHELEKERQVYRKGGFWYRKRIEED